MVRQIFQREHRGAVRALFVLVRVNGVEHSLQPSVLRIVGIGRLENRLCFCRAGIGLVGFAPPIAAPMDAK